MSKKEGKGLKSFNKGFQVPDTYIIIFLVVVVAALLTFLVPKGFYETQDISYMINGVEKTRTVIKDGSFQYLTDDAGNVVTEGVALFSGDGGTGFFNYMYNGIVSSSAIEIIAFLMVVGGAFGIMIRTGAIESGLIGLIRKAKGAEKLLIPILFVLFSLGGAVFGMGEEALPFTMILCPLFVAVGYDSVIAVLVTYVATQIGFGSSWMNPFSVGIAQGIAGIDVFSGAGFRMVMWVVFTALGCGMTMFYASKIKKTPTISIAYKTDAYFREQNEKTGIDEGHSFGLGHILVLLTLAATVVWVVWGVMTQGYYMPEIATQFFIMGIVSGVIGVIFKLNDMKLNDIATSFKDGAKDLIGAALVVAMAQGIMQVLGGSDPTTPTVINTIMTRMIASRHSRIRSIDNCTALQCGDIAFPEIDMLLNGLQIGNTCDAFLCRQSSQKFVLGFEILCTGFPCRTNVDKTAVKMELLRFICWKDQIIPFRMF